MEEPNYILYEIIVLIRYEGYNYPIRCSDYSQALEAFEEECKCVTKGYDKVWLEGINSQGYFTELKEY